MNVNYNKVKKVIKNVINDSMTDNMNDFINKIEKVIKKIVKKASESDLDLTKILGLATGLRLITKKKNSKKKRMIIALILASLTALTLGLVIKSYNQIKEGENTEEKIKIFIKSLNLDKIKDNPTIKKIRTEINSLME